MQLSSIFSVRNILFVSLISLFLLSFSSINSVSAQNTKKDICSGANLDLSGDTGCQKNSAGENENPETELNKLIKNIVNIFSIIVGIVAVIMLIVGGFNFITSGGDSGKVTSARNTILYAIIGIVIVVFAQVIVRFVLQESTKETTTSTEKSLTIKSRKA